MSTELRVLEVPAECSRGHELTSLSVYIRTELGPGWRKRTSAQAVEWTCLVCDRIACYRAHFGAFAVVPAAILEEPCRVPQRVRKDLTWPLFVEFRSGKGSVGVAPGTEREEARRRHARAVRRGMLVEERTDRRAERLEQTRQAERARAAQRREQREAAGPAQPRGAAWRRSARWAAMPVSTAIG